MASRNHPFFNDVESLKRLLAERALSTSLTDVPYGTFEVIHRPRDETGKQGYVVTANGAVGVWASYNAKGDNIGTTFWGIVGGELIVDDFEGHGWGTSRLVEEADKWYRSKVA